MVKKLLFILFLYQSSLVFSQFGNEWINYDQQYYSFKVFKNGVYRLDYDLLLALAFLSKLLLLKITKFLGTRKNTRFGLKAEKMELLDLAILSSFMEKKIQHGWIRCFMMTQITLPINTTHFTVTPFIIF